MSQSYTNLVYHFVFSTKYREHWLTKGTLERLLPHFADIVRKHGGLPLEMNGVIDHVHLLVRLRPDCSVSDILRALKSETSGRIRRHPDKGHFGWQNGYGAFTVGWTEIEMIGDYIRRQEQHHQEEKDYREEFMRLCRENGVEFDEATMWD